jgi:hypothetical protein
VGSHDTTANMIALGTLALLEHPEQLAKLRDGDDPKRVASAVEELLRYLSIAHNRSVGWPLRTSRSPARRSGPTRADHGQRHRQPRRHGLPGPGVPSTLTGTRADTLRSAPASTSASGQPLARMELQVVYGTLYRRISTLKLATTVDKVPFKHDGVVYGVYELPVTW